MTVGFHIGSEFCTIDLDVPISQFDTDILKCIEREVDIDSIGSSNKL